METKSFALLVLPQEVTLFVINDVINRYYSRPHGLQTTLRYAAFMIKGLAELEETLRSKRIPFRLLEAAEPRGV